MELLIGLLFELFLELCLCRIQSSSREHLKKQKTVHTAVSCHASWCQVHLLSSGRGRADVKPLARALPWRRLGSFPLMVVIVTS